MSTHHLGVADPRERFWRLVERTRAWEALERLDRREPRYPLHGPKTFSNWLGRSFGLIVGGVAATAIGLIGLAAGWGHAREMVPSILFLVAGLFFLLFAYLTKP